MPKKSTKKSPAPKAKKAPKVRKIMLTPDEAVRIHAPPGVAPLVVPVARNVIEIVPVPGQVKNLVAVIVRLRKAIRSSSSTPHQNVEQRA